jgi:uncharacterized membrane protein
MTIALARFRFFLDRVLAGPAGTVLLGLVALLLRLYRLDRNPFWLDELFEYQVSLEPPPVIFRQVWYEPWPPLYHFLIKLTSGSGLVHAEWAWRYLSVAAGTLAAVGLYWLLRDLAGPGPALLTAMLLVISPMQLYFSQEARAYMLIMLVVVLSTAAVRGLSTSFGSETAKKRRWRWVGWVVVSLFGLHLSYSYTIVWIMQAAYLLWIERARRQVLVSVGLTALAFAPLLYWIRLNLGGTLARAQTTAWLTLPFLARMAFGGDPNRYGYYAGQAVLALLLGGLALIGGLRSAQAGATSFERYLALQIVLPLIGFFGVIDGLLHLHIPSYQARQFIVLLPAFYGLVGLGLRLLFNLRPITLGQMLGVALWAVAAIACLSGLQRYWTMTKSPEGDLVLALRQETQPGDAIVSLHYSLDAALSFYGPPGVSVFAKPVAEASGYAFSDSLSILYTAQYTYPYHLSDIRRSQRVWVLAREGSASDIIAALSKGCTVAATQDYPPFEILRLADCAQS